MKVDVLIIGSGIAGLSSALRFSQSGYDTVLVSKSELMEGSTRYAQGGIASVWSKQDSFEGHIQDTIQAGAGLSNPKIVEKCVHIGPSVVQELIEQGVKFTKINQKLDPHVHDEEYDLHKEGGHGFRRILHSDDLTGYEIERALLEEAKKQERLVLLENHMSIDLITEKKIKKNLKKPGSCLGAYVLHTKDQKVLTIEAKVTILATGGMGKVYLYTTNPDVSTGDGVAMAFRAGALVSNLEFMQFHPTCLFHPKSTNFLITEALRGEGAVLRNLHGEDFMKKYHPQHSLAPRDIVSLSIDTEMKKSGSKHVWLDATSLGKNVLESKFPNIYDHCFKLGMKLEKDWIPVVPAAHYMCGGVQVNEFGESNIPGLYAIGEVACSGLHGANRLASNSLLEAAAFSSFAFLNAKEKYLDREENHSLSLHSMPEWDFGSSVEIEEQIDIASSWLEIRQLMWNYAGIVRSNRRLERAKKRIDLLKQEIQSYYWEHRVNRDLIELRNLVLCADLIIRSASHRKESRGLHFNRDYPEKDSIYHLKDTVILP